MCSSDLDIGDFSGTLSLAFDNGNVGTLPISTAPQSAADGSVLFWGIITTPSDGDLASVDFQTTAGTGDVFAFDNMTIGSRQQVTKVLNAPSPLGIAAVSVAFGMSRRLRRRCLA